MVYIQLGCLTVVQHANPQVMDIEGWLFMLFAAKVQDSAASSLLLALNNMPSGFKEKAAKIGTSTYTY